MELFADFFDALRRMKPSPRNPAKGPVPDRIAPAGTPPPAAVAGPPPTSESPRQIGPAGLALIQRFEGCARRRGDGRFDAYPDPGTGGDPWTIGWGATGPGIARGTVWTQDQCDARLQRDLTRFAKDVVRALGDAPTSQAQFDAMVSFHYNTGAITRATLTKLHKAGQFAAAQAEFGKWVHAGGRRLEGLVRRRAAEASLYANG